MVAGVLLRRGTTIFLVEPNGSARRIGDAGATDASAAREIARGWPDGLPPAVAAALSRGGFSPLSSDDPTLRDAATRSKSSVVPASLADARRARESAPALPVADLRRIGIAVAREALSARLAMPEAELIALTRESIRLERALGRESSAVDQLLLGPGEVATRYSERATTYRATFERHVDALRAEIDGLARRIAPNLSEVVGPALAARLIAAAGGIGGLARSSASRLQLLGSRRRPAGGRGPRYGLLYRAPGLSELPPERRGAYARSLAALAIIALRADATTGRPISARLVARRDRRLRALRGGR